MEPDAKACQTRPRRDPLVTNRFLLWSVAALCTMASIWTVQIPTFLGYEAFSPDAVQLTTVTMLATSALGIVTIGAYWLTFFRPVGIERALT